MRVIRFICHILLLLGFALPTVAGPAILSDRDVAAYQRILKAHQANDFKTAKKVEGTIKDKLLMGYVLYDRYFSKGYRTKGTEIVNWLNKYSDLAVASDVYALGVQKKAKLPPRPRGIFGGNSGACLGVQRIEPIDLIRGLSFSYLNAANRQKAQRIMRQIERYILAGKTLNAKRVIEEKTTKKLLSKRDLLLARTALAFSYFIDDADLLAMEQLRPVLDSGMEIPLAWWTAGLVSWRQENYPQAGDYFEKVAKAKTAYPLLKNAGAVWAARSLLKQGKYQAVGAYLEQAASFPRTFYGLLAMRMLGQDLSHVWDEPATPSDDVIGDFSHPALTRFYALRQIGADEWAQKELAKLYLEADTEAQGILLMISQKNGFADDLLGIAGTLNGDEARYPAPNWTPQDGWKVDKALVFAFVRQESCFNKRAESAMGALGLMQIMPQTGREQAALLQMPWKRQKLKEPAYNLSLGQNYLLRLMASEAVQNNLIFTAVAYNAGPGNLMKWKKKMNYNDDPLLFLESIPSKETRSFVERIIVNYWIYRSLMGASLQSLDDVVQGNWPMYIPPENE